MRSQKQWPSDPQGHLVDFFGQYRDPMWDRMDEWKQEMDDIRNELPVMEDKIVELQKELEAQQRKTFALNVYKNADPDVTVSLASQN